MFWKKNKIQRYSVKELLRKFEEIHLPTVSQSTRTRYELDLKYRIRPHFELEDLKNIDRIKIESFRSQMLTTLSPKSVNNCTGLLKLVFNKGVEWGMLEKSPIVIRQLKLTECKYDWWSERDDITRFLSEAKKIRYYSAFLLALECGLRLGEIVGLSKQDVDLKRSRIHVHRQWLDAQGCLGPTKGRNQRFITFDPKSDLGPALAEEMERSNDPETIFVTRTGRRIRSTKLRCNLMPMLIRRSGVPLISFHDMRHTFASWYMLENDDIWTLMRLLGHADIQTTQRYAHLSAENLKTQSLNWKNEK